MAEDVGALDDTGLPRGIVGDELAALPDEVEEVRSEGLGPDGRRETARVAVFLPDQERPAVLIAGEAWVDGADLIAEDGTAVDVGAGG